MFAVSQWGDAHEGRSLTQALFPSGQKGARRPPPRSPKTPSPAQLPQASTTAPPPPPPKDGAGGAVEKEKKKRKKRRKLRVRRGAEEGPAAEGASDGAGEAEGSTRKTPRRRKTPVDEKWRPKRKRTRKRPSQSEAPADGDADKTETRKRKKPKTSAGDAAEVPADELGECANDRPPRKKAKAESAEGDEQSGDDGESGVRDKKSRKKPLTRKQWQNRMKSKRRIRNKYKQRELVWRKEPEEPVDAGDRQVEEPTDAAMQDTSLSKYKTKKLKRQKEKEEKQQVEAESRDTVGDEAACEGDVETVGKIKKKKKNVAKSEPKRRKAESPTENGDAQEEAGDAAAAKSKTKKLKSSSATKRGATNDAEEDEDGAHPDPNAPPAPPVPADRSAALRLRMQQRLQGARFRFLNQQLYEGSSRDARALFRDDPQAFQDYHQGFTAQVQRWPVNPLSRIISSIKNRPASLVVADFGCGDAQLAASVRNHVHSFDLVALNERVTACDMAKVPLDSASVDVAVFCLSLMGTNIQDFLTEANRVLRSGGVLMIAEVASRFEDARNFLSALSALGFKLLSKNMEDSHFHLFELQKTAPPKAKEQLPGLALKPCVYKKR